MNRSVILALLLLSCSAAFAQHDVVVMKNGDRFTGTVKKLESGVLYFEVDYVSGDIGLDWFKVATVQSAGRFQVTLENGARSSGEISRAAAEPAPDKEFTVQENSGERLESPAKDVIEIRSQKANFWRQLTGSLDFGYDFTSGNSQTSLTTSANATYTTTRWTAGANMTTSFSGQSSASKTNLVELQTLDGIYFHHNSYLLGIGDFLHSSQQSLDLRATLGGAYGRYWIRSNASNLSWFTGLVYAHENFTPGSTQSSDQNVEGLAGIQYQLFHFDRYQLQSQLFTYPGLSDIGRLRATPKLTFSVKLTNNFHSNVSFWDNYDSEPPANSKGNEMGVSSSVGWTF